MNKNSAHEVLDEVAQGPRTVFVVDATQSLGAVSEGTPQCPSFFCRDGLPWPVHVAVQVWCPSMHSLGASTGWPALFTSGSLVPMACPWCLGRAWHGAAEYANPKQDRVFKNPLLIGRKP